MLSSRDTEPIRTVRISHRRGIGAADASWDGLSQAIVMEHEPGSTALVDRYGHAAARTTGEFMRDALSAHAAVERELIDALDRSSRA